MSHDKERRSQLNFVREKLYPDLKPQDWEPAAQRIYYERLDELAKSLGWVNPDTIVPVSVPVLDGERK